MKKDKKILLYSSLLIISIIGIILFFLFLPDGLLGYLTILISIYLLIGSIIKLCKLSEKFQNTIFNILDLLFWLP